MVDKLLCTGSPPLTRKSLTRFPLTQFLAYVRVSGGISVSRGPLTQISCDRVFSKSQNAPKVGTLCTHNTFSKLYTIIFSINFVLRKTFKKRDTKVSHNHPKPFFHSQVQTSPTQPSPQPKIDFSYYKYVPRHICLLVLVLSRQKLGLFLENKVLQKSKFSKNVLLK